MKGPSDAQLQPSVRPAAARGALYPSASLLAAAEVAFGANRVEVINFARRGIPVDLRRVIDVEDVAQDVCLEFFRRCHEVDLGDAAHVRRLLLTITRHQLIDLVRAHRATKRGGRLVRVEELADMPGAQPLVGLLEQLAVYERTPSQSAIAHELADRLQQSLAALPPDYASCLRMRHIEQRTVAETAGLMNRTEGAIQMLSARALNQLKAELLKPAKPGLLKSRVVVR